MGRAVGYAVAIKWIVDNDETEWVRGGPLFDGPISTSAILISSIYRKPVVKVVEDIRTELIKREKEKANGL